MPVRETPHTSVRNVVHKAGHRSGKSFSLSRSLPLFPLLFCTYSKFKYSTASNTASYISLCQMEVENLSVLKKTKPRQVYSCIAYIKSMTQ